MKKIRILFIAAAFLFNSHSFAAYGTDKELISVLENAKAYNDSLIYESPEPFKIYDPGTAEWIDYEKYGRFVNPGTPEYKYEISDAEGLKAASGEGIYPNTKSVLNSPQYNAKKLKGSKWKFVDSDDNQRNFYKWAALTDEDPGIKLYYTALALERSGNYKHAVKAYYACLIFFPRSVGYTQWKTPWYVAPVCASKIKYLTSKYPETGVKLAGCDIVIENTFDNDTSNDVFRINPGKLIPAEVADLQRKIINTDGLSVSNVSGTGKVKLIRAENGHYFLTVDDKPYVVRGISYTPNKTGLSPDFGTLNNLSDWSFDDYNKNGKIDGAYDAYVDTNRNNKRDPEEKSFGDFALMKEMGINTLRLYHYDGLNKALLKDGYEKYGFMYLVGNLIGMYGVDSGAGWFEGTDYTDEDHKYNMLYSIKKMVEEYRDEPYVLMWVLGNENNYGSVGVQGVDIGSANKAPLQPQAYYEFVNECAKLIKSLDPQKRPVVVCNGDTYMLDHCAKYAPDVDVYGANAYRGNYGFGQIWRDVSRVYGKPVLITEYGCPAYAKGWSLARIEEGQADYHKWNWNDIEDNLGAVDGGAGNALGGVIFEWTDEWWKAGASTDPSVHDKESQWSGPFLDGKAYEEWFGICGLGNGGNSTVKRQLRKAYFTYRDLWKKYSD